MSRNSPRTLLLVGLLLVSLNLRPAISSVPPLLEVIRNDLGLSYAAVSFLTTVPVLCMGLFALLTPFVTRTVGRERGIFWGVVLIGVATAVRIWGYSAPILLLSAVVVGIGIAITQTLLPSLISLYFPDRVAFATGLYTASLALGAMLASTFTAPLRAVLGSWPEALALWAGLSVLALLTWGPIVRQTDPPVSDWEPSGVFDLPYRTPFAWLIMLLFAGQAGIFFAVLTWLPPRYVALGWSETSAGLLLTVFFVVQLLGTFAVSAFADRSNDRRPWFVGSLALVLLGSLGIAFAPETVPTVWAGLLGAATGSNFALVLTLPVDFAADETATDRLSSMTLAGGNLLAAAGPFLIGAVRDLFGSYVPAFVAIAALGLVLLLPVARLSPRRAGSIS